MGKKWCSEGEHLVPVAFQPKPGERWCPDHPECSLVDKPKEGKAMGRAGFKRATAASDRARRVFNNVVCARRCFFSDRTEAGDPRRPGHRCGYPLDGHHLIEKQWIKQNFSDLPEDELLWILFNPLIGAPLCRKAHQAVKQEPIYLDEVSEECIEFCEDVDRKYPTNTVTGHKRPSMLERLKLECPPREPNREAALTGSDERSR